MAENFEPRPKHFEPKNWAKKDTLIDYMPGYQGVQAGSARLSSASSPYLFISLSLPLALCTLANLQKGVSWLWSSQKYWRQHFLNFTKTKYTEDGSIVKGKTRSSWSKHLSSVSERDESSCNAMIGLLQRIFIKRKIGCNQHGSPFPYPFPYTVLPAPFAKYST